MFNLFELPDDLLIQILTNDLLMSKKTQRSLISLSCSCKNTFCKNDSEFGLISLGSSSIEKSENGDSNPTDRRIHIYKCINYILQKNIMLNKYKYFFKN